MEIYKGNTSSSFIHHFISQCANYWEKLIKITTLCYMAYFLWTNYFYKKYNDTFICNKNYEN
jgi:hypothetical protein